MFRLLICENYSFPKGVLIIFQLTLRDLREYTEFKGLCLYSRGSLPASNLCKELNGMHCVSYCQSDGYEKAQYLECNR
jgi:hypothetical protein